MLILVVVIEGILRFLVFGSAVEFGLCAEPVKSQLLLSLFTLSSYGCFRALLA